ncbi:T-cell activation Rho GTPase activating protein, putative [Entamoeba dispar SAW760]|uniref:T-cell activation Rho GTPase activating protein, putative n=1 Tax=Entamoeba dispar (strain ATCC PRA-260 / SAW760) TaxID=370354 RepID=B0E6F0_ENTDS|nr:T-cell activation Rho GTPase activating protein, putative [Entamoeba dispar SAW760]EDR29908.1 T-cell activation Rho GTPase activating protein, putative [Entamoeba dispar SAW760]|eukprot:EDR29908.1 T-cell activation Rho GTPase activating protein, putative [Entamoeba dispar SAW760]
MKKRSHEKVIKSVETKKQELPKILSFWEKQKMFLFNLNQKLSDVCELVKAHCSFLEESQIHQITGFNKNCHSEHILEAISFIGSGFDILKQEMVCSNNKADEIINELKNMKKLFYSSKNSETLTSTYYNLNERIKWETPLLFSNIFHGFQTLFTTGDLFFSCNDTLTMITEQAQKAKQNYVIKNVEPKPNVLYCGTKLKEILESEGRPYYQLPRMIENILIYLYNKGCTTHGIFRETTNASIRDVEEIYHRMGVTDFEDLPPDVVANVFKKFLREMKEKVFPYDVSMYLLKEWQKGRAKTRTTSAEKRKIVLEGLKMMPPENVTLLRSILKLCSKIDSMSDINAMTNKNLAVCLAPTLMTVSEDATPRTLDLKTGGEIVGCIEIITFILIDYPHIYPNDVDVNVTRRSRRMSQRLVTCLAEGMNEEEEIYKGIEQIKKGTQEESDIAKSREETNPPLIPKPLLDDIRMGSPMLKETRQNKEKGTSLLKKRCFAVNLNLTQQDKKELLKENDIIQEKDVENSSTVNYDISNPPPVPPRRGNLKQKQSIYPNSSNLDIN